MSKVFDLLKKHREIISYLFFGGCTTLINIIAYYVCYNVISISNVISTIIAWIISVLFAFVTNKLYVLVYSTTGTASASTVSNILS